jgi:dGTPase
VLNKIVPGGFRHYEQSLRVVEKLEGDGNGLNLTWEVRDGILKHSKGAGAVFTRQDAGRPSTLEGQVVRVSDIIAYVNHDVDDAIRSGLIRATDVPDAVTEVLGDSHSKRINTLVTDVVHSSLEAGLESITMSPGILKGMLDLRQFLYASVYSLSIPSQELSKAKKILSDLYYFLVENAESFLSKSRQPGDTVEQTATDFAAGMTDRFAVNLYGKLFLPQSWNLR